MTSTPTDEPDDTGTDTGQPDAYDEKTEGQSEGGPGAEIGMTDGEGSTFEPEEDPEGHQ